MRKLSQFSSLVAVAVVAGCTSVPPVVTHITSEPTGARIEVNNGYVGTTPVDVTLLQTPNHHRLKRRTVVVALPVAPGQKPQEKVLQHLQEAPRQMWFDMNFDGQVVSNAPANPPDMHQQPAEAKPPASP